MPFAAPLARAPIGLANKLVRVASRLVVVALVDSEALL